MASLDNPTEGSNAPVQHSTFKHHVVAWVSQHVFGSVIYKVRNGRLKGMKRKGGLGWIPRERQSTPEDAFWDNIDLRGKVVYDVGAFEGMLTLYFAQSAKHVVSFEPNSRNYKRLAENVRLNDLRNVTLRTVGMGKQNAQVTMVQDPLVPGMASTAGVVSPSQAVEQVEVRRLDSDIASHSLPAPEFIKIDIEGMELDALHGAEETIVRCRPQLFLEMHGDTLTQKREKTAAIVEWLLLHGYDVTHVESGVRIHRDNSAEAAVGHLYAVPVVNPPS